MLRQICVAYDDDEPARWGLELAARFARRASARLTIVHVMPPVDEAVDRREQLLVELLGLDEVVRRRQRLMRASFALARDVATDVHVLTGRVSVELLALLHHEQPDLLVTGSRVVTGAKRLLAPRLRHALLADAPCPVMFVCAPPARDWRPVILCCSDPVAPRDRSFLWARALATALRWRLVRCPAPRHGRHLDALSTILAACRKHRPALVVAGTERCHGWRNRAGTSPIAALIDAAPCPVLVVTRHARETPPVCDQLTATPVDTASSQPPNEPSRTPRTTKRTKRRARDHPSHLWQLIAANAAGGAQGDARPRLRTGQRH